MIGQTKLLSRFTDLIEEDKLPRFIILVGQIGSGRKTISYEIGRLKKCTCVNCGVKVDEVREIIQMSYTVTSPTLYILSDADSMSLAAKNAMLKVMEEPPNNAYFILTLQDLNQTLDTIRSRGSIFHMDAYTPEEILEYAKLTGKKDNTFDAFTTEELGIVTDICETPFEVNTILKHGVIEFRDYVQLVIDNIAEVSGANSFKIADKIALKDEDDKYNLALFWKAFMKICSDRLENEPFKYASAIKITSKYFQELFITGINKQSTFDMWLLDIRSEWME